MVLFPILGWSQSYVGTIDRYPIHLEINNYKNDDDSDSGTLDGYYFYDSQLISIPLSGIYNRNTLTITDGYFYNEDSIEDADEFFQLKKEGQQLTGTVKLKEKTLQVVLTETQEKPLEDFRNPKLTFIKDSISNYNGKELVWFHEKYSKLPLFRLGNGFTKAQRNTFNPILDVNHLEDSKDKLNCNSWFDISYDINLVNDEFISYLQYYSIYCGGAHPSHGSADYNFNLQSLEVVEDIEALYPNVDFFQLLKNKYYNKEEEQQQECETFTDTSHWDYKNWNLTAKGVILIPQYPHAMTPCEEDYFVSYSDFIKN